MRQNCLVGFPKRYHFMIDDPIRVQGARRAWCCQGSSCPGHLVHVLLHPLLEGRLHRWQRRLPPGLNLLCKVFFAHIVLSSSRPRRSSSSRILSLVSQFSQSARWPPMVRSGAAASISCSREPWDLSLADPLVRGELLKQEIKFVKLSLRFSFLPRQHCWFSVECCCVHRGSAKQLW